MGCGKKQHTTQTASKKDKYSQGSRVLHCVYRVARRYEIPLSKEDIYTIQRDLIKNSKRKYEIIRKNRDKESNLIIIDYPTTHGLTRYALIWDIKHKIIKTFVELAEEDKKYKSKKELAKQFLDLYKIKVGSFDMVEILGDIQTNSTLYVVGSRRVTSTKRYKYLKIKGKNVKCLYSTTDKQILHFCKLESTDGRYFTEKSIKTYRKSLIKD